MEINKLETEMRNYQTMDIDQKSTREILQLINAEDRKVPEIINDIIPDIEKAVDVIYQQLKKGGRLIYLGAGTSGRLGVLDAAECPPTFGVDYQLVQGLMAGGNQAIMIAKEGAEDSKELGILDLKQINLSSNDVVCGLAASGRTPYVIGGLEYAKEINVPTVSISCVSKSLIAEASDYPIQCVVGAEVVTGSTRMKAGTAQKLILNMLSTTVMIKLGKVYQNLMVDVKPTNEKLKKRAIEIIKEASGVDDATANYYFQKAEQNVKVAIVMCILGIDEIDFTQLLKQADGSISKVIKQLKEKK